MEFIYFAVGALISWLLTSIYNRKASQEQSEKLGGLHRSLATQIDEVLSSINSSFQMEADVRNPSMKDGGKVSVDVSWQDGPIMDIGNPNALDQNRLLISASRPNQISLDLFDSQKQHYRLESAFVRFFGYYYDNGGSKFCKDRSCTSCRYLQLYLW